MSFPAAAHVGTRVKVETQKALKPLTKYGGLQASTAKLHMALACESDGTEGHGHQAHCISSYQKCQLHCLRTTRGWPLWGLLKGNTGLVLGLLG